MSLNKSYDDLLDHAPDLEPAQPVDPWRFQWPNPADFNFNYWRLLKSAEKTGIGKAPQNAPKVAVIGAGVAGLTAARELYRSGYKVDIYEATDRIGGRLHSIPVDPTLKHKTCFEIGAMRMPFFPPTNATTLPYTRNCVLAYYAEAFGMTTEPFPNPDGMTDVTCGIYLNEGQGTAPGDKLEPAKLLLWGKGHELDPKLGEIAKLWKTFADSLTNIFKLTYNTRDWPQIWHTITTKYDALTFRDVVRMDVKSGGIGMSAEQAALFYVMGMGDGGWGAFYDISALFPIRTILFGYGLKHQLVKGCAVEGPTGVSADSNGTKLAPPNFLGIQSLPEALLYAKSTSGPSLYAGLKEGRVGLYTRTAVGKIHKDEVTGKIDVHSSGERKVSYDAVVVTVPSWALQMGTSLSNFGPKQLTWEAKRTLKTTHWITSCKVFFRLKKRYWGGQSPLPQLFATDTFLQGVYGYAVGDEPGALLVSYTWEDDATKMMSDEPEEVVGRRCLSKLDAILTACKLPRMEDFVEEGSAKVFHWTRRAEARGCSKLYRARTERDNRSLLTHNQRFGKKSGLYFAGEGYSVEGGWTEPALRMALDAVVHIIKDTGGSFTAGDFDFEAHYPKWQVFKDEQEAPADPTGALRP